MTLMRVFPDLTVDGEFEELGNLGHTGSLNDRQFKALRGAGYTGGLADMMKQFFDAGGTLVTTPAISGLFFADAYTGNGGTQSRTMSFAPNLAILKRRDGIADWGWFDTERGATKLLSSNSSAAEATDTDTLTTFNVDGVSLGADTKFNTSASTNIGYFFKEQAGFHDVVAYTGDGVGGRTVTHSLGEKPGMMLVRRLSGTGGFFVYHKDAFSVSDGDSILTMHTTGGFTTSTSFWNDTPPTDTVFSLGTDSRVNGSGGSFVSYLFAHNPDNGIHCGSYTGNGSTTGPSVNLDWEPQFLMIKRADSIGDWWVYDSQRDSANPRTDKLLFNSSAAEDTTGEDLDFISTGFQPKTTATGINATGGSYIFMAIQKAE